MKLWIYGDDINFAYFWVEVAVDFCPTECGESRFADITQKIKQETVWVEPLFGLS